MQIESALKLRGNPYEILLNSKNQKAPATHFNVTEKIFYFSSVTAISQRCKPTFTSQPKPSAANQSLPRQRNVYHVAFSLYIFMCVRM